LNRTASLPNGPEKKPQKQEFEWQDVDEFLYQNATNDGLETETPVRGKKKLTGLRVFLVPKRCGES